MTPPEMQAHLKSIKVQIEDIEKIVDWIYSRPNINRLDYFSLAGAISSSRFTVLEANRQFIRHVPDEIGVQLRKRYGKAQDYGVGGLEYVLIK